MSKRITYGSVVKAKPGTVAEIFSDGTNGIVAELRDPKPYSGNDSNNLIRWNNGKGILMGFRIDEVEVIN